METPKRKTRGEVQDPGKSPKVRKMSFDKRHEVRDKLGQVLEKHCSTVLNSRGLLVSRHVLQRNVTLDPPHLFTTSSKFEFDLLSKSTTSVADIEMALNDLKHQCVWPEDSPIVATSSTGHLAPVIFYGECALSVRTLVDKTDQLKKHMRFLAMKLGLWEGSSAPRVYFSVIISSASEDLTEACNFLKGVRQQFAHEHGNLLRHFIAFVVIRLPIPLDDVVGDLVVISEKLQCDVICVRDGTEIVERSLAEFRSSAISRIESLENENKALKEENKFLKEEMGSLKEEMGSLKDRLLRLENPNVMK